MLSRTLIRPFCTTLDILTRNKTSLNLQPRQTNHYPMKLSHPITAPSTSATARLQPYMHMSHEYIHSVRLDLIHQFKELDVFRNKLVPNQALANGEDYQDYQLIKIIQICLKYKQEGNMDQQLWERIEKRVAALFRNTSALENIILFYVSVHHFSPKFQQQLLEQIKIEHKTFTQMQRQLLFYTLCRLNTKDHQLYPQINKLKQELLSSIHKSKLSITSLTQWIIMIAIANASNLNLLLKYYDKVFLYEGAKDQFNVDHFCTSMACLEARAVLAQHSELTKIRQKARMITQLMGKISNSTMMMNSSPHYIRLKMLMNFCNPRSQTLLSNEQFLSSSLTNSQKLKYLQWIWRNDYMQSYQIKSLYESVQLNLSNGKGAGFDGIDLVYYGCAIELGLGIWLNYKWVLARVADMPYVPNGLQWILWNYLAYLTRSNIELTTQQKNTIEQIINKIKLCQSTHDKVSKLATRIQHMKQSPQIKELIKFFHSIKAWNFSVCEPIGPLDYIAHFVNAQMKIILHCLRKEDLLESAEPNQSETRINNRHGLDKKMLKDHFGYQVIDVKVTEFMGLNYGERVQWLRQKIAEKRANDRFIDK